VGGIMTKELSASSLVKRLTKLAADIIKDTTSQTSKGKIVNTRELKPAENYVRDVFLSAGELMTLCNQLDQAVRFITGFRSTSALKAAKISRLDYVLYHLENHLVRTVAAFDRALILVNEVFVLGNETKNCKPHIIMRNRHVSASAVIHPLKELDNHVRPYREARNTIVHKGRYSHDDLGQIEMMDILQKEEKSIVPYHLIKRRTDIFVRERKTEMIAFNEGLITILLKLFDTLEDEFRWKYAMTAATNAQQ
jgi:hypothetical protein